MALTLSSTQIGKIGETIIGAQLMLVSGGRLTPFLPIADDDGVDLMIRDKVTGRALTIQVKGRVAKENDTLGYTQFDVRTATFRAEPGMFLLAIILDLRMGAIDCAWLIPTFDLPAVALKRPEKLAITPNPSPQSQDRYTPYRCHTMSEVVDRLIAWLDRS